MTRKEWLMEILSYHMSIFQDGTPEMSHIIDETANKILKSINSVSIVVDSDSK